MHKLDTGRARERGVEGMDSIQVFFSQLKIVSEEDVPLTQGNVIAFAFSRRRGGFDGMRR